jgi:hypothetical protein
MLYKVSRARTDNLFEPSKFWRSPDWSVSMKVPHESYILDEVLYAGDFNDVNIHLLPNVPRLRIWLSDRAVTELKKLDIIVASHYTALIIAQISDWETIETFCPTINYFDEAGFELTPSQEYISRTPQTAIKVETISIFDAIVRWNIELYFVEDYDGLKLSLNSVGVRFSEQT